MSYDFNIELIEKMVQNGVDLIEVGLPFSDPLADGEVIQKANLLSLKKNFKIQTALDIAKELQKRKLPFVFMGYFNTFLQNDLQKFIDLSLGCIIPDLPHEEATKYQTLFKEQNKAIIELIAPTTPLARAKKIVKDAQLFIYLVAYTGVTGKGTNTEEDLLPLIQAIKETTDTDIYLGFGVTPQNAQEKAKDVDGVIIGSYFVNILLDEALSEEEKIERIARDCREIKSQL